MSAFGARNRAGVGRIIAAFVISTGWATASLAQPSDPSPLSAYGALPGTEMVRLSPSGDRLAFVTVVGDERAMVAISLTDNRRLSRADIGKVKVRDLDWVDEERIQVTTSSTQSLPSIGLDKDELYQGLVFNVSTGRFVRMLNPNKRLFPVLMSGVYVRPGDDRPDMFVRAYEFDNYGVLNLYRVDAETGNARLAEPMSRDVDDFLLDDEGRSIVRSSYDERSKVWRLQFRRDGRMQESWRTTAAIDTPSLMGLGLNGDSVIVAADRPDMSREGREDAAFFDVDFATGNWRPVRFEFDPDALVFHPVTRRLMGASRLEDDGRRYAFADDDAARLWGNVVGSLPGTAPILTSWSDDLRTGVVFTSGPGDAGTYRLIDLDRGEMRQVGLAYPAIPPEQVAPIEPIQFAATDGLTLHGYLTTPLNREAKDLPLVVLAHGGPAARDALEFDWWSQALASRGYAVLQVNFRGSTGYGEAFTQAGHGEWGRKMQTDLSDGVRHLAKEGIIDPARTCIVGASYGGYAALAGPTLDLGVYRCAVSVAGVSNLRGMLDYEADRGERRDNSAVRYWNRFMGGDGPGDRSLDARSPVRLAERADAPILLLHGRDDVVVPVSQSRQMAQALRRAGKPVELVELDGEDHWLSRPETRTRMLTETVRFLETHNPARP